MAACRAQYSEVQGEGDDSQKRKRVADFLEELEEVLPQPKAPKAFVFTQVLCLHPTIAYSLFTTDMLLVGGNQSPTR